MATSSGLAKLGNSSYLENFKWNNIQTTGLSENSGAITERSQSVVFDKRDTLIYVATQDNLIKLSQHNKTDTLTYKNKPIIVQDLLIKHNTVICGTKKSGLLFIKNDSIIHEINTKNGLRSNAINKISLQDNKLFVWHNLGFQVFDEHKNLVGSIGMSDGLQRNSIKDFSLSKDNIWVLTNNKLISYPIDNIFNKTPDIQFSIDSISATNRGFVNKTKFNYNENNLKFFYTFKGVSYVSESEILYKLEKFENSWTNLNPSANFIEYKYLPPGNYNLQVKVNYENYSNKVASYKFTIKTAFWNTWWFRLVYIGLFISAFTFFISRRIGYIKKRNDKIIQEEKLKTDLLETQLKALRSQMNPHFIFNSLNSIQDLILEKKTDDSYDYIVLFSDLVRDILNYSNKNYITLKQEISFLKRYLKLEKLRFGSDFSFELINNINEKRLKIPPLLIQPFIENAIVHGLFHKKGDKNLHIEFTIENNNIICKVEDNGIGRVASNEIKLRQGKYHKSFALNAIQQRFKLLTKEDNNAYAFTFYDLYDNKKSSSGTKVIIKLPIKVKML